jgi:hypothetical protein
MTAIVRDQSADDHLLERLTGEATAHATSPTTADWCRPTRLKTPARRAAPDRHAPRRRNREALRIPGSAESALPFRSYAILRRRRIRGSATVLTDRRNPIERLAADRVLAHFTTQSDSARRRRLRSTGALKS